MKRTDRYGLRGRRRTSGRGQRGFDGARSAVRDRRAVRSIVTALNARRRSDVASMISPRISAATVASIGSCAPSTPRLLMWRATGAGVAVSSSIRASRGISATTTSTGQFTTARNMLGATARRQGGGLSADPRRTPAWKRARARVLKDATYCELPSCQGPPLDFDASPTSRWAPSVDHITPVSIGGEPFALENLRAVHFGCNSARGNGTRRPPEQPRGSQRAEWW
jgi:hypothetical protein